MNHDIGALCGYDVHAEGSRRLLQSPSQRRPPCRRPARFVIRSWIEPDLADLYLCGLHARAIIKLNPDHEIELDRVEA